MDDGRSSGARLRVRTKAPAPDASAAAKDVDTPGRGDAAAAAPPQAGPGGGWRPARTAVFVAYLASLAWYAYVRATTSLNLGPYTW